MPFLRESRVPAAQNVKVTLKWFVATHAAGEADAWLVAEREIELPFMPFIGLEIFFLVRAEDARVARAGQPGKRELRYVVDTFEYWMHSGEIVLGDLSHGIDSGEPSSHPRELWQAWFEDAGFSLTDEPPREPAHRLRMVGTREEA